jgi:hypothetical protein
MDETTENPHQPSESGWLVLAKVAIFLAIPTALVYLLKLFLNR